MKVQQLHRYPSASSWILYCGHSTQYCHLVMITLSLTLSLYDFFWLVSAFSQICCEIKFNWLVLPKPTISQKWYKIATQQSYGRRCLTPLSPHRYDLTIIKEHYHFMTSSSPCKLPLGRITPHLHQALPGSAILAGCGYTSGSWRKIPFTACQEILSHSYHYKKASIRWQDSAHRQFQAGLIGDVGL